MHNSPDRPFDEELRESPQLGICISYPAPGIIERIGGEWDWLWIDGQHGQMGYSDILNLVRAAGLVGRPTIVRTPGHEAGAIGLALDMLPAGVMVPMVENEDQARAIVRAAKFPPLGSRSYGGRRPIDMLDRGYAHADRKQPMLVCQIETPEGVDRAESIAAVEGVDVLFFGPDDMALRAGLAMDRPRPEGCFNKEFQAVAAAAAANGKLAGSVFATPEAVRYGVEWGYRLIVGGGDMAFLTAGSQEKSRSLRAVIPTGSEERGGC